MLYLFEDFELDTRTVELRRGQRRVSVEPQVFSLLLLLTANHDRMVSKEEILEKVWDSRIVSDSALASRIKSARRAVGDDGKTQRVIRTVHGKGFHFVATVTEAAVARSTAVVEHHALVPSSEATAPSMARDSRPSLAVLPFRLLGDARPVAAIADALPDELISELARLHWLLVIARGSSFRFRSVSPDAEEVGKLLGVRYCLSGVVEVTGRDMAMTVRLVDTRSSAVIWAESFRGALQDVHELRATLRGQLLAALEIRIPRHEAEVARFSAPQAIDAWASYHLGLQHMYRFNRRDNAVAAQWFERAVARDPEFARAHAGLSFVRFQNAFLRYQSDIEEETRRARGSAERGLELDPLDPFVNFTMGRTFWLEGDLEGSLPWLERATDVSPNYAHGIYAQAWAHTLAGREEKGRENADLAMALSPLDPLHYAMLATRALAHLGRGEDLDAAHWAERAARSPGAHVLIAMIAVAAHSAAGDDERARSWAARVHAYDANIGHSEFFRAFPLAVSNTRGRVAKALQRFAL